MRPAARPTSRAARSAVVTLALLAMTPSTARAATPEEEFDVGKAALDRKDYAVACPALRRSYVASDARGALYQLARCEDEGRAGRLATALKLWQRVQERFTEQPDILREATGRVDALREKAARIVLERAPTASIEVRFELDGAPAPLDIPILVDAGAHTLSARAPGYPTQTVDVIVKDGESRKVEFDPGKKLEAEPRDARSPQAPPPAPAEPEDDSSMRTAGFILGGIGVGGLVLFGVSAPIVATAESDLDELCPTRTSCNADAIAASDRGKAWLVPNAVGLITGVVGVGLGVTFLILGAEEDPVVARVGPGHAELVGRF